MKIYAYKLLNRRILDCGERRDCLKHFVYRGLNLACIISGCGKPINTFLSVSPFPHADEYPELVYDPVNQSCDVRFSSYRTLLARSFQYLAFNHIP